MNALFRNLTTRQLVVIGFVTPLVCTIAVGWLQWHVVTQLIEGRHVGKQIRNVQVDLGVFRYSLSDAESCQFRYILTQTPGDLDLYTKLMGQVSDRLTDIKTITAETPVYKPYLDQVDSLLSSKEQSASQSFEFEKHGNHAGAMQIISSDASRQNMLQVEDAIGKMETIAAGQIFQRQNISAHNIEITAFVSVAGLALNLACIAVVLLFIRRLQRLQTDVTLVAIKEMISYEDGKMTIEEYLARRAAALSEHGKAQIEAERIISQLERRKARVATTRVPPVQTPPQ